ncbi:hypothetical protein PIB30_034244 [Stylosanthes scabra]|uniref:Uncharacterized protein n=1 Tax=Stylosanthes scabra TaxID=79078 RepID=A0ABU6VEB2_9FABA|nr:hypothetical protein [Stylosanthes scabra]
MLRVGAFLDNVPGVRDVLRTGSTGRFVLGPRHSTIGSGVIYYEYEEREKFEDFDMKADAELGTFKIRCYYFGDESFVHPQIHFIVLGLIPTVRLVLLDVQHYIILRKNVVNSTSISSSSTEETSSSHRREASKALRKFKSWEITPPSEGWMCEGNEEEKEIGGMKPSVKKEETSEEDSKEEEDSEEEIPASSSLSMDIDATEDYLHFTDDLEQHPEYSSLRSSQASVPDSPEESD